MAQAPPHLYTTDGSGNHIVGQLNDPVIANLIAQDSLSSNTPWHIILSHPNSTLATYLQSCWTILQAEYQQQIAGQQEEDTFRYILQEV
eukprot:9105226-Ditylum_brightwellii.AAC.1